MILTLSGKNGFSLERKIQQLIDDFVAKNGSLTIERIDGEEAEFSDMRRSLSSLPFLASKQLLILRDPSKNKKFLEQSEQLLDSVPDTTDVIIVEPKLDKRLGYYKYLRKRTDFQEFPEPDNNELVRWLMEATKERGGSLSLNDARYLVERVGINQQLVANELDKLILYDQDITRQTIDVLTEPLPQSTIFQLLEAAFSSKGGETLKLYTQQRSLKVEPRQIIAMLSWQLHVVSIIKAAGDLNVEEVSKESGINPFVVRKSQTIARKLSLSNLKKLVADLEIIDRHLKRSLVDPDEALQYYLLNIKI